MARGIIYVMTTAVSGLIKIGKTGIDNFEQRMYQLERNGYANVTALKRRFAIEVEDYDEKEVILDEIFSKSKVSNTELYALDVDLVVQLLSSFEGEQVYPKEKSKEEVFDEATQERKEVKKYWYMIPNGTYFLSEDVPGFGQVEATMEVDGGDFIVKKGSICAPSYEDWQPKARRTAIIKNNVLMEDVVCSSPSTAGWIPIGKPKNGWFVWKDSNDNPIDIYRNPDQDD